MVWRILIAFVVCLVGVAGLAGTINAQTGSNRLVTMHDKGVTTVFLADAKKVGDVLKSQGVVLDSRDRVEPSIDEELVAAEYRFNIYRAQPVVVIDGPVRIKTLSAFQSSRQIATDVGITTYDEDLMSVRPLDDVVADGAGLQLTIIRATPFVLDLYGSKTQVRTQATTVAAMLQEKNIVLGESGRVSLPLDAPITAGMDIRVWREGKQTVSVEQEIPVSTELVYDADRPIGYRAVQTKGLVGLRSVTYQLEIKDGAEISRIEIANIVTRNPTAQIEVIGILNNGSGLTASRGAQYWTDSMGVSHRETYYDLNMSVVMKSCGQGGFYTVRPDGAKVDDQGYVIVAANYGIYPKCTVVETSLGAGKVYDTGGFALRHPYGFDLATDWTRYDGI